ncbi:MAG: helix-turn-helix transcriptional regulator [Sphingomonas sp.]|uniref:helix-turn-helix domain-containing protein n=1 Tax=Sphingomonas sp. TaxID=28214 RepID=UPI0025D7690A|nr:helix-turn-helix transcriptional regulator [Sphingomonas sp.]MBQ1499599.1 helix-turn-helix transcriptional regulator [Sphingomonas sp.]MBQ8106041.1 helix-turn-helix transcriptional regulator [Afipia sp.]
MPKTIFTGDNQIVVEAIRAERLRAGMTQAQLAARLHKDQSWVSLMEGSQRRLDVVEFIKVAEALDVEPTVLLGEIVGRLG